MVVSASLELLPEVPTDYLERVYAGVLGKIIGVYVGRPVENWSYERIRERLGEIRYYVHEELGRRLIITDDDISGTFVFLRSMEDHGLGLAIGSEEIGKSWLNYLIERKTILWWGGFGNSTEHTAYLRLKAGIQAPESGAMARNGQIIAEQIGAQIFIEGWGMLAPGAPDTAAKLAERAGRVSHDGEAIYGAQVIASMVSQAFVERRLSVLLDGALGHIPQDCVIARMIKDLRQWHAVERDWRENRLKLEHHYGYDTYGGNCHIVPNHGAVILSLLHGEGNFSESMHIVNTLGWDTDCNSGNVGCIIGIRNGLEGLTSDVDWRGPVADRMFLPCANPGVAITDALRTSFYVANMGRQLHGQPPVVPKAGARFHFSLPGSVQGFRPDPGFKSRGALRVSNAKGQLELHFDGVGVGRDVRAFTDTFVPIETRDLKTGYELVASPTLHEGQLVRALIHAPQDNEERVFVRLDLQRYDSTDELTRVEGPGTYLSPGDSQQIEWTVPSTGGFPIAEVGVQVESPSARSGRVLLDWLTWEGIPRTEWKPLPGRMWARAWGAALSRFEFERDGFRHMVQDQGTGLLIMGSDCWDNYAIQANVWVQLASTFGIAARVQGLRRYYSLAFEGGKSLQLARRNHDVAVLASVPFEPVPYRSYQLRLEVRNRVLKGYCDGQLLLEAEDAEGGLEWGGCAFLVCEGCMGSEGMSIEPLD